MVPYLQIIMVMPEPLDKGRTFTRIHNNALRDAHEYALVKHKRETTPKHFKRGNWQRYNHTPRTREYRKTKRRQFKSTTDLVKTGKTRDFAKKQIPKVTHRGSADSGNLRSRYTLVLFNFRGAGRKNRVKPKDMAKEVGTVHPTEAIVMISRVEAKYIVGLRKGLARSPRIRKRVGLQ